LNDFYRDPDLDRLVEELNRTDQRAQDTPPPGTSEQASLDPHREVTVGSNLQSLLLSMTGQKASDLLLISGATPFCRVSGELVAIGHAILTGEDVRTLFAPYFSARVSSSLDSNGSADFSLRMAPAGTTAGWRFRVNLHRQRGQLAASVRSLPQQVPTLADLNLPLQLSELVRTNRGLVLVCGPTGSGKTSTLAALVGEINRERAQHIVTIEDPIEYEHRNDKAVIEQIEIGKDAPSFASALRASLRQDPDVILVGEMRDLDTVATALTAAETGHLILSTLHTSDSMQAVHRIIDVFPSGQQSQIRHQLALSLNAIVCQQLVPNSEGDGRVPAIEVLIANQAVRNHIRQDRVHNLLQEITLGRRMGMVSLEDSLAQLAQKGVITQEEARLRARRAEELDSYMK